MVGLRDGVYVGFVGYVLFDEIMVESKPMTDRCQGVEAKMRSNVIPLKEHNCGNVYV